MKKALCVLSAILLTAGSFANVNVDSNPVNAEIVCSEFMYDEEFDSCYDITTWWVCDADGCREEVIIARVSCNQQ